MIATAALAQAVETVTEEAEAFHITFGEAVLTGATILLALVTILLAVVSARLVKATTMAANAELAKVAMNANDDMRDVATAAIAPTPRVPVYAAARPAHHRTVITRHPL